jgi:hypothetical protein
MLNLPRVLIGNGLMLRGGRSSTGGVIDLDDVGLGVPDPRKPEPSKPRRSSKLFGRVFLLELEGDVRDGVEARRREIR